MTDDRRAVLINESVRFIAEQQLVIQTLFAQDRSPDVVHQLALLMHHVALHHARIEELRRMPVVNE